PAVSIQVLAGAAGSRPPSFPVALLVAAGTQCVASSFRRMARLLPRVQRLTPSRCEPSTRLRATTAMAALIRVSVRVARFLAPFSTIVLLSPSLSSHTTRSSLQDLLQQETARVLRSPSRSEEHTSELQSR